MFPDLVLTSRQRPQADGNRRGRNRRIGQPPRSDGAVGAPRPGPRALPPLCAGRSVDIARRLRRGEQVNVAEIWSYHTIGDQTRFTLVHRGARGRRPRKCRSAAAAAERVLAARRRRRSAARAPSAAGGRPRARSARPQAAPRHGPSRDRSRSRPAPEEEVVLPYLRFSRDKRGYENTFVIHTRPPPRPVADPHPVLVPHAARRHASAAPRWTRTPSGCSKHTTRTSSSTGRGSSKEPGRPEPAVAAASAIRRDRDRRDRRIAPPPRPDATAPGPAAPTVPAVAGPRSHARAGRAGGATRAPRTPMSSWRSTQLDRRERHRTPKDDAVRARRRRVLRASSERTATAEHADELKRRPSV